MESRCIASFLPPRNPASANELNAPSAKQRAAAIRVVRFT
jgi:hypothetical protein